MVLKIGSVIHLRDKGSNGSYHIGWKITRLNPNMGICLYNEKGNISGIESQLVTYNSLFEVYDCKITNTKDTKLGKILYGN